MDNDISADELKDKIRAVKPRLQHLLASLKKTVRPAEATVYNRPAEHDSGFDDGTPPWSGEWDNSFNDSFRNR